MQRILLRRGVALFNRGHFFDAHEVLEDVWRPLPRDSRSRQRLRLHVQGMVQLAVAFHHVSSGNLVGARSVLERALRNLNGGDRSFPDLDLDRLRADLTPWREYLNDSKRAQQGREDRRQGALHLPKIVRRR
jgi:predicted metal-dependent hydrolase